MIKRLYDRVLVLASHKRAQAWMGFISFIEAIFFPIPVDVMLIPMVLAEKKKAWSFAWLATYTSVLGGVVGYLIGFYFYDSVGHWVIEAYGSAEVFHTIQSWYIDHGMWVVLLAGFLPIPYKVFTIASGVFSMALFPFIIASTLGRGMRYFAVALTCYLLEDAVHKIMARYSSHVAVIISLIIVGGLVFWSIQ